MGGSRRSSGRSHGRHAVALWNHFGIIWEPFWDSVETILGPPWTPCRFSPILGSVLRRSWRCFGRPGRCLGHPRLPGPFSRRPHEPILGSRPRQDCPKTAPRRPKTAPRPARDRTRPQQTLKTHGFYNDCEVSPDGHKKGLKSGQYAPRRA